MRVLLNQHGVYRGLKRHLEFEGDEVVVGEGAELTIPDPLVITPAFLGIETVEEKPTHYVSRFWNSGAWSQSTFLGLPMLGLMNEDKGNDVCTGSVGRYVAPNATHEQFCDPGVEAFLKELQHHGFVSFIYADDKVVGLQTGVPYWGLYAILEGLEGQKISDWWKSPSKLYETWSGALLVSRYPYPVSQAGDKIGLQLPEEEHLWMLGGTEFKGVLTTTDNELCIITGMDREHGGIHSASRKIRKLAEQVRVEGVQYRTDMGEFARARWSCLREKGVV